MRANEFANLAKIAVAIFTSLALSACGGAKAKNGTLVLDSTGTSGSGGANTSPTSANFTLNASFGYPSPNYLHNAASADWSGACQVPASSIQYPPVASGFIACYLEASEFDLYMSAMTLAYSAPAGACDYIEVEPYLAWQYQPNIGASSFTANINAAGNMTLSSIVAGNSNLPSGTGVRVVNNTAVCQYDYSQDTPTGPNCCPGKYAETIITTDSTGGVTTSVTKGTWGGTIGNCAAGPAVEYATAQSIGSDPNFGMPRVLDIPATAGYAGTVAVSSPLKKGYNSVAYNANYVPSLSGAPSALTAPAYGTSTMSTSNAIYPRPYYAFTCYTHGYEAKGRILLQVRKWNLLSELAKGSAGNWNSTGTESDPQSPGNPNDDFAGWQDYSGAGMNFPGATF